MSSGERMRVLLARALAVEADWLLADEPITTLDPAYQLDAGRRFQRNSWQRWRPLSERHSKGRNQYLKQPCVGMKTARNVFRLLQTQNAPPYRGSLM